MQDMEQRKEEIARRPLYVYDLPGDILNTLVPKEETTDGPQDTLPDSDTQRIDPADFATVVGAKACSLCGITFNTVEEQRGHIRSDLHGYNLKQKLRGHASVTEEEFEKLIGDLDESLSGSDSSDSEDDEHSNARKETTLSALLKKQAAISSAITEDGDDAAPRKRTRGSGKAPFFWFTTPTLPSNTYLGIYKAIFAIEDQGKEAVILDILQRKQLAPKPQAKIIANAEGVPPPAAYKEPHIFMCMIGGGHFAAMIVSLTPKQTRNTPTGPMTKEATVLAHKTFHRYTTRRKQGGAQSSNDNAKGAAHSAGSSLRRYNEQALTDEVRQLLQDWKGMIDTSELIFIRATGNTNRRTLFGPYDGQVMRQNDPRIRGFPFNTRRATQNELMRAFVELTRVKVQEVDEAAIASAKLASENAAKQAAALKASKQTASTAPKLSEEQDAIFHTGQIHALIRRSKIPALLAYFKNNDLSPNFVFKPSSSQQNHHASTTLLLAASQNSPALVTALLTKAGADPTVLNGDNKPAFDITNDRATRDAFRVARHILGPSAFPWDATHIPSPLTPEEATSRDLAAKAAEAKAESERRKAEVKRLEEEGPKVPEPGGLGKNAMKGREKVLGKVAKSAQEKREEETRGMTPEMRMRLERERRARAAEARIKAASSGGGAGG